MSPNKRPYLNTKEAAAFLGRTEPSIRSLVFRRQIPFRRVGGRLCFLADELDHWIREESPGLRPDQIIDCGAYK